MLCIEKRDDKQLVKHQRQNGVIGIQESTVLHRYLQIKDAAIPMQNHALYTWPSTVCTRHAYAYVRRNA